MESRFTILVINDDGVDSPLLLPFLDALSKQPWCKELRVVVPMTEQSWVAQCITRFRELEARAHTFGTHHGFIVDGTPADCTTLGIHNLFANKPDIVLSGVNMGWNAALPFFMSSGTVGSAAEAFLTKVPAIALSAHLPQPIYQAYSTHNQQVLQEHLLRWPVVAEAAVVVISKLIAAHFWMAADIFSVNLPWDVSPSSKCAITGLMEAHFEKLFIEKGNYRFTHKMQNAVFETPRRSSLSTSDVKKVRDVEALEQGLISITPISYNFETTLPKEFISQVESPLSSPKP